MNKEFERLENIANTYFGSLSQLSIKIGRVRQFLGTYRTKTGIGRKLLKDLEDKCGINPEYIKFGNEPIFLHNTYINESPITIVKESEVGYDFIPDITKMTIEEMKEYYNGLNKHNANLEKIEEIFKIMNIEF